MPCLRARSGSGLLWLLALAGCSPPPPAAPAPGAPSAQEPPPHPPADPPSVDQLLFHLDDQAARPHALGRLLVLLEESQARATSGRKTPEAQGQLGKIIGPLARQYARGDLDGQTRAQLLKALAGTRDPGAKDAIIKAISDFAAGKAGHHEMSEAAGYVKALRLKEAAGPLLDAFAKIEVSNRDLGPPYMPTRGAMLAIADPAWKPRLLGMLDRPIPSVDPQKFDRAALDTAKNEVYWQTVSAELLGELQATEAVRPLFRAVMLPDKKNIAATAVMALIKIGKPAVAPLLDVLAGKDAEMARLASDKTGHIQAAALALGSVGRPEARDPMIAALRSATDDAVRALIGRELPKLPSSPGSIKAFEAAFEKIAVDALIPPGEPARVILATSAEKFMDASMVPWLVKQVGSLKTARGDKEEIDNIQAALLQTAMKVMKKDQIALVKRAVDAEGDDLTKKVFAQVTTLLDACGDDAACYLARLGDPATQEKNEQFVGIKAIYTLGSIGNEGTRAEVLKTLPGIKNDIIRFEALNLLDHLSPGGDRKIADELQGILDEQASQGKETPVDPAMRQIIARLRARAS